MVRCTAACALFLFALAQAKEEKTYVAPPVLHARTYAAHDDVEPIGTRHRLGSTL